MKIFDFNIHLPYLQSDNVNLVIEQDMSLDLQQLQIGYEFHKNKIKNLDGLNILLFNPNLINEKQNNFFKNIKNKYGVVKFTALIDFRQNKIFEYIDNLKLLGVNAIMFNSYLQQIKESDFLIILTICKYASEHGFIICIDGSFGTSKMYKFDNLKLACFISDSIIKTPIVIVHGGGSRIIDAMLLASDKKNIWLDTSFSLPFYIGSSLEKDFSFAIKKLNFERIIFGSDHPYVDLQNALKEHFLFFQKYNFKSKEIEKIMWNNSQLLFNDL